MPLRLFELKEKPEIIILYEALSGLDKIREKRGYRKIKGSFCGFDYSFYYTP
ncbi:hypothetical protein [Treponema pedis]|uniref:hypothetical protein n=1 Tax=Treponema pedis TaxID=409322 RepID=UPI0004276DF5|nr:hypothetical protein [Treponema pedis]